MAQPGKRKEVYPCHQLTVCCFPSPFFSPSLFCADDADESLNDHDDGSIKENFREQDIYLPIANVARIMKNAVPQTGKVSFQLLLLGWFGVATAWAQRGRWLQPASKEQMLV